MKAGEVWIKDAVWDEKWDPKGEFIKPERTFIIGKHITNIAKYTHTKTDGFVILTTNDYKKWYQTFFADSAVFNFERNSKKLSEDEIAKYLLSGRLDIDLLTHKRKCKMLS